MLRRVQLLTRALLRGGWGDGGDSVPVAPLLFLGVLAALVAGIVRGEMPPFAYGLVTLTVPLALVTLPLLGELAPLLRADPAAEWVGALPIHPRELRAARVAALGLATGALAAACMLPAAVLAVDVDVLGRLWLVVAGILQAWFVAALLLWIQALLGERGDALLTLLQAALLVGVVVGMLVGVRQVSSLTEVAAPTAGMAWLPFAWFAAPLASLASEDVALHFLLAPVAALALVLLTFTLAPFPPVPKSRSVRSALGTLLRPFRRIAEEVWVRPDERASFGFVYEALPAERDFVLRTYPLIALPLAFLLLGADPATIEGQGLYVLLLFAPVVYLPFVMIHVPATATPEARWLLDTAPLDPAAEARGARKALAVRLLLPLYLALVAFVEAKLGATFALSLGGFSAVLAWAVMNALWDKTGAPPLSTSATELGTVWGDGAMNLMLPLGIGVTVAGLAIWRLVPLDVGGAPTGLALLGTIAVLETLRRR